MIVQAFLYASGELEGTEALSFEHRLGEDQAARDALCQAVLLCQPLRGQREVRPDPLYRERVRQRLQCGPTSRASLGKSGYTASHLVLWGGLGAAAAALLTLTLQKAGFPAAGDRDRAVTVPQKGCNHTTANGVGEAVPADGGFLRPPPELEMQRKTRAEEPRKPDPPPWQRPRMPIRRTATN
jgi:hypothetical protein